ncbi:MAG: hypothetical protein ABSE49_05885 [Polyangiaceae bacterium]
MLRLSPAAAAFGAVLSLAMAPDARANAPAPFVRSPENLGGAFVAGQTSLVVEHEDLSFRCDSLAPCSFRAVYHVLNPGDAREEVLGAFYGIAASDVTIRADGADARHELTAEQLAVCEAAVRALQPEGPRLDSLGSAVRRVGFTLAVAAHARAELVFEGGMNPMSTEFHGDQGEFVLDPHFTRHPWLSTPERGLTQAEYAYAVSPIRSWGGSPTIDVTLRVARGLEVVPPEGRWTQSLEDGAFVARASLAARDVSVLRFFVGRGGTTLLNGGPFVGAGGRIGPAELRTRLGYEVAYPSYVLYSAAVETSFHGRTTLVPMVEAATPDILVIIPSLGLGAGVPVQLRAGEPALVGGRLQLTVSFPVISLVVPFDWFPGGSGSEQAQIAMLAQASF